MKTHTEDYKKSLIGKREIKSELKYVEDNKVKTLKEDDIEAIKPILNTDLFKSVMKQLDIESKIPLALNTIVNYKNGLKVNGEYEYINYGSYIVYETEYRADTKTYYHICYDKMLYAMEQYKPLTITYPITVREYINTLANSINLNFALKNETFVNYNKQILKEHFDNGVYTYRDIFDYLSEVVGGWLYIDNNNNLSIKYPTETNETFNADFLDQVNIDFNNKYGPVNSIVFARANETDNIEYKDDESIAENGLYRIKFSDNPILSDTNRNDYLSQELKEKIIGIEYYLIDIVNKGITYLELGDYFNYILSDKVIDALKSGLVKSGVRKAQDKTKQYKCLLLNDEITINSGIKESIYSYEPEQNEQEYMTTAPSDNSIKNAEILVNKNAGELVLKANSNGKVVQARLDADADDGSLFEIQADNIDLTGYVTISDLAGTGTTTINGSNVTTGTIKSQNYVSGTSGTSINLVDGVIDTKNFKVNNTGSITATGGTIGGWQIDNNGINNGVVFLHNDGTSTIYTVADLFIIRGYILGIAGFEFTNQTMIRHYDLNNDGVVDASDYVILKNLIGLEI